METQEAGPLLEGVNFDAVTRWTTEEVNVCGGLVSKTGISLQ